MEIKKMTKDTTESFERRVAAYLEMKPIIIVLVLNFHFKQRGVFNQSRFFDLRCFTEALRRSPIDTSKILSEKGQIVIDDGPFRSEFRGMGGMNSDWKIIPVK
tara:strand:- start:147 stop:455 length:309 start_codon:yes stop_codon:yes gene_type:complete